LPYVVIPNPVALYANAGEGSAFRCAFVAAAFRRTAFSLRIPSRGALVLSGDVAQVFRPEDLRNNALVDHAVVAAQNACTMFLSLFFF
jgi:hypothetical protein